MFFKRSYSPEIMDDFSIQDSRIDQALVELKIINKFLGGNSTTRSGINYFKNKIANNNNYKILDVGSGASDIILSVQDPKNIISVDINLRVCKYVKINSSSAEVICADAKTLPFNKEEFDIVHASLFFHHFDETEIEKMLQKFLSICKSGIVINDLRRSVIAYLGIKILTSLFSKSEMVKNDGPLSVKRGFIKSELINILTKLNHKFIIKRKWAFRWLVVIYK